MKTILTSVLCAGILLLPVRASAPEDSPPPAPISTKIVGACALAIVVIVVGTIVIIGVKKMCDKIPDPQNCRTNRLDEPITGTILFVPTPTTNTTESLTVQTKSHLSDEWQDQYTLQFGRDMSCRLMEGDTVKAEIQPTLVVTNGEHQFWYDLRANPIPAGPSGFVRLRSE